MRDEPIKVSPIEFPGCFLLQSRIFQDNRGTFVKIFHEEIFKAFGLETNFAEEYYSFSYQGVLRGLHFQLPPHDHVKIVYCVQGRIMDAIVDLRKDSPTYGNYATYELSSEKANALYLAKGIAHGFYVLSEFAIVVYKVTSLYSSEHDTGILWNSVGIPWPDPYPIMSERDKSLVPFADFKTPFSLGE